MKGSHLASARKLQVKHFNPFPVLLMALCLFILMGLHHAAASQPAEASPPRVLLLHSYHDGYVWTDLLNDVIKAGLEESVPGIDISTEYLDWKRYPTMESFESMQPMFEYRYLDIPPDLILTTDDAALDFALEHRTLLFADIPIVFNGVTKQNAAEMTSGHQEVTGVYEHFELNETIRAMGSIIPNLDEVVLIYDNTETGIPVAVEGAYWLKMLLPNVTISHWNELPAAEIRKRSSQLSEGSAILYMVFNRDVEGRVLSMDRYADYLFENSSVPVFGTHGFMLGHNVLGGSLMDAQLHGDETVGLALRILQGASAEDVLPVDEPTCRLIFDHNEMVRFGISKSDLPDGSEILNQPFNFYQTYRGLTFLVSAVILFLLLLTVSLLLNIRSKKRMQMQLQHGAQELMAANEQLAAANEELLAFDDELRNQNMTLEQQKTRLESSEERYQLVERATRDAIWDWDIPHDTRLLSERIIDILGLPIDKVKGMEDWFHLIHEEDRDRISQEIDAYLKGQTSHYSTEYRVRGADGSYHWIQSKGIAVFGNDGKATRMVGTHADITEAKRQQDIISRMAYYDVLTELPNRVLLKTRTEAAIRLAQESSGQVAILFSDLDNFKYINDNFGHPAGDELLTEVGRRFMGSVAPSATVGRIGGDEFVVLIPNVSARAKVVEQAEWILERFRETLHTRSMQFHMGISIGIALYPSDGLNFDSLMRSADSAMYAAKNAGKNQFRFFDEEIAQNNRNRFELEEGLRHAMERKELFLHYQPLHRIENDQVEGFEALLRWNSTVHGNVTPGRFIPIAEETGLIGPIGRWVLREACRFIRRVKPILGKDGYVTVNVSALQLLEPDFVQMVQHTLMEEDVDPSELVLEITESVLMESFLYQMDVLRQLNALGVKIALDDFGTGYSSLTYLQRLPISILKIDKSFIDDIRVADDRTSHTGAIISLAKQWGFAVVAEGVEHDYQVAYLKGQKCDLMQGYLRSKPLPENEALSYAQRHV